MGLSDEPYIFMMIFYCWWPDDQDLKETVLCDWDAFADGDEDNDTYSPVLWHFYHDNFTHMEIKEINNQNTILIEKNWNWWR